MFVNKELRGLKFDINTMEQVKGQLEIELEDQNC